VLKSDADGVPELIVAVKDEAPLAQTVLTSLKLPVALIVIVILTAALVFVPSVAVYVIVSVPIFPALLPDVYVIVAEPPEAVGFELLKLPPLFDEPTLKLVIVVGFVPSVPVALNVIFTVFPAQFTLPEVAFAVTLAIINYNNKISLKYIF
jgi:hypothetical protein